MSTNLFWKQIYREKPPRSLWQNFRHMLSLLLQLLLLFLLAAAITDPYLTRQLAQARRIVLVLDRSASMQAADIEPTRFAAAISAAHAYIDGMKFRDEMAVVLAGVRPEVKLRMNSHVPTLRRAISSLQAQDGPTKLGPAIDLARRLIGEHPQGQIIVLTDGCTRLVEKDNSDVRHANTGPPVVECKEARPGPKIQYRLFATGASNVGITQFQVRRSLTDALSYEILSQVTNASNVPVQCRLELELNGMLVDIVPMKLEPDEVWSRSFEKTSLAGGALFGRLTEIKAVHRSTDDEPVQNDELLNSLLVDDRAWTVLADRKVQKVLIVSPGNLFLQKVFEANPLVVVEVVNGLPELWPPDTLIVLHRLVPPQIPAGNVLIVDPAESSDLWTLGEWLADPIVTIQDKDSLLMTHLQLESVLISQVRRITTAGVTHALACTISGDPVYVEFMRDTGRCLLLNTNLEENDLAFRTAFPIMVSNALSWFAGTNGDLRQTTATGEVTTVELQLPNGNNHSNVDAQPLRLLHPNGDRTDLPVSASNSVNDNRQMFKTTIGPLSEAGLYSIVETTADVAGETKNDNFTNRDPLKTIAVNLSNSRESDLRPTTGFKTTETAQTEFAGWLSRPLWFYLAVLACMLAMTEWFLFNRRFTD